MSEKRLEESLFAKFSKYMENNTRGVEVALAFNFVTFTLTFGKIFVFDVNSQNKPKIK